MINKNEIEEEIEKTLAAYDDDPVLKEKQFLLTRIQGVKSEKKYYDKKRKPVKWRANLAISILILLLNIVTLVYYLKSDSQNQMRKQLVNDLEQEFQVERSQDEL